jgi:hypothetical protein
MLKINLLYPPLALPSLLDSLRDIPDEEIGFLF